LKEQKRAIVTAVSGEKYGEIWKLAEPFFVAYAEKCDAELIVLHGGVDLPSPHWIKFSIRELLKSEFSRVAWIDADIIIRPDAPSLFDIVPEDQFGIFNEGQYTPRSICIYEVMKVYAVKLPKWDGKTYYNTGVMVLSREHRHIFAVTEEMKPLRNAFGEQTYLNMRILASGVKVFPLSHTFNRMSIMDRITGMSRLNSYLIHYAGDGDRLLVKMARDIKRWSEDSPAFAYKQQIFVWALGGLGDVIAAEPVIRYMRKMIYPDADIYVMSDYHELYRHIEGIERFSKDNFPDKDIDAIFEVNTHPTPFDKFTDFSVAFGFHVPHGFVHPIDWVSISVLNRQLPLSDREIHLETTDDLPCDPDLILVHPGRGWETKTFPVEWWQEVIDGITAAGFKVGIIGKEVSDKHGYVPVTCPENGIDLRDKLSLQQMINLIAKAPLLISNDSAPVHIAGAFDNGIILIPTCKHPDNILPFRKGQQYYKAAVLYKNLIEDVCAGRATDLTGWQLSTFRPGKKIEDYLPDAHEVINTAISFNRPIETTICLNKKEEI
jgi:ADP-heptose:LPS heptosyltransferase